MKWLLLTAAHHAHVRNVARALDEREALGSWLAGLVFRPGFGAAAPWITTRTIQEISRNRICPFRRWELLRVAAARLGVGPVVQDRFWERGEQAMDARGARMIGRDFSGAIGFEHGCLETLRAARGLGKRAVVWFTSVHHATRSRWVDPEYARQSDWADASETELLRRSEARDARRDLEAHEAELVFANSGFTKASLIAGGVPSSKIVTVPLGLPLPQPTVGDFSTAGVLRVIYVGTVGLHKGFHDLQQAFLGLSTAQARLDVFGTIRVRRSALARQENIVFHGAVPPARLAQAYAEADVLVFPTLCDGFGMVVGEALSHGVPVICSENAGAVDFIKDEVNGFRVPAADSGAIHQCLIRCLDDRATLQTMRAAALRTAGAWNWDDFRRTFFEALCGGAALQGES